MVITITICYLALNNYNFQRPQTILFTKQSYMFVTNIQSILCLTSNNQEVKPNFISDFFFFSFVFLIVEFVFDQ